LEGGGFFKLSGELGLGYIFNPNTGKAYIVGEASGNIGLKADSGASIGINKFFAPYVNTPDEFSGTYFLVTAGASIPGTKIGVSTGILVPVDLQTGELNIAKSALIESASLGIGISPGVVTMEFGKTYAADLGSIINMPNPGRRPLNDFLYLHHPAFKIKGRNAVQTLMKSEEAIKAIKKLYNESRK
jgi:hypothetical protein